MENITKENESSSKQFVALNVEIKTPATAVLLLSSSEEDIVVKACNGIRTFAEKGDDNKVHLLGLRVLDPLAQLITHSSAVVRRKAVMILGTMSTHSDVKNALKKIDVIPSIVDSLSMEDFLVHEFATLCLASLSEDDDCRAKIFDSKGLPPLIQLLSSPDSDVQLNTLEVIDNMVQDRGSRQEVHKLGAIRPLLELLNSDFPVIQDLALKTLEKVTTDETTLLTFREDKGLEKLMDILSDADVCDLHVESLKVFSNCLRDSECVEEIQQNEGLEKLIEFILTSTKPEIHFSAIKCITRVVENSDIQKLKKHNVEKILVNLLPAAQGDDVKTAICEAVQVMSPDQASTDRFRDLGAIPEIVKLLNSKNFDLKEAATQALCGLINRSKPNALAVFKAGGHTKLISQLGGDSAAMVANSAAAICNMAGQEVIHSSLLANGAIQALVKPLNSTNTQVLVNTLHCLEVLACNTETRAKLQSAKGLRPLVNLLRSDDKEVLQNACIAINTFARDQLTAIRLYQLGALEMLQDINQLPTRRTRYSRTAMITLLNFNVPVKFGLLGHLASTDKISDGFYDVGKVEGVDKILTLEELAKQPINNRQPIIAVSTGSRSRVSLVNAEGLCLMSRGKNTVNINEGKQDTSSKMSTGRKTKASPKSPKKAVNINEGRESLSPKMSASSKTSQKSPKDEDDSLKEYEATKDVSLDITKDDKLEGLIKEVKETIVSLNDDREKCAALARLVSRVMGGEVEMEKLHEFSWMLHLSQLKLELESNVIPIGLISYGYYRHRALLFKCLADSIDLKCTLTRGKSHCAWNEVLLFPENFSDDDNSSEPSRYIVDLMHQPGQLLAPNSPAAVHYMRLNQ